MQIVFMCLFFFSLVCMKSIEISRYINIYAVQPFSTDANSSEYERAQAQKYLYTRETKMEKS
jgi:hypothetical protein